jgi:predicted kinase
LRRYDLPVQQLLLTRGLPASGKTTWAKARQRADVGLVRVSKDDLRAMLRSHDLRSADARLVDAIRDAAIIAAIQEGFGVIVDDTNTRISQIEHLALLAGSETQLTIVEFETGVVECLRRDRRRGTQAVGEEIIRALDEQLRAARASTPSHVRRVVAD